MRHTHARFGTRLALVLALLCGLALATRPGGVAASGTFTVTRVKDLQDTTPGDGRCDGIPEILMPGDQCTLRAAIMEANALNDDHTIVVPVGTYVLTLTGAGEDSAETGDLDVLHSMTIQGAGVGKTIIDANGSDRAFDILGATTLAQLSGLTIQHGTVVGDGGAIHVNAGALTLTDSQLSGNTASNGGGIAIFGGGTATLKGSVVDGNTGGSYAGGIEVREQSYANLFNSTVSNNHANGLGGGGITNWGTLTLVSSTISTNHADFQGCCNGGGGIWNYSSMVATNTTISGNTTGNTGGGIEQSNSGKATLRNVTLYGNKAYYGGGIFMGYAAGPLTIANSIIAGNTADGAPDCAGTLASSGHNLLQNTNGCTFGGDTTGNKLGISPILDALVNNGGPTKTQRPRGYSPVIDAGSPAVPNSSVGACEAQDQRGVARPVDGKASGTALCDIGAVEYIGPVVTSISPATKLAGGAGFTLTVTGIRFGPTSVVRWNNINHPTSFVNSTKLTAQITASDIATGGVIAVRVYTPGAITAGGLSNAQNVTVNNPVPAVVSLSPASKPKGSAAFTLTVTGSNFTANSKVRWNNVDHTTTFVNSTKLTVAITALEVKNAGSVAVQVSTPTPGGGLSNAKIFTITP